MENIILTQLSRQEIQTLIKDCIKEALRDSYVVNSNREDLILSITQAASFLGLSKATLYYYTSNNLIPFNKNGKRLFFLKADLMVWMENAVKLTTFPRYKETTPCAV